MSTAPALSSAAPAYIAVPVDSLVGEAKVEFDLYVQLATKHVLYLRKGGVFDAARLAKIREKNVRNLWITQEDEGSYRRFMAQKLEAAYDGKSAIGHEERIALIHGSQIAAVEALMKKPNDPNLYHEALENAKRLTDFLLKNDHWLKSLLRVPGTERSIASHGVAVASLSVIIAKKLGLANSKDLHLLTMGALIHDIGHFGQKESGFDKPQKAMSTAELKLFRDHAAAGLRIAEAQPYYDKEVLKIIFEHEEYADGSGHPKGLNERQLHVYSLIVGTANSYDRLVTQENDSYQAAVKTLFIEKIGRHPLAHLNAVKAIAATLV